MLVLLVLLLLLLSMVIVGFLVCSLPFSSYSRGSGQLCCAVRHCSGAIQLPAQLRRFISFAKFSGRLPHLLYHNIRSRIRRSCTRHTVRRARPAHCPVSTARSPAPIVECSEFSRWPFLKLISFRRCHCSQWSHRSSGRTRFSGFRIPWPGAPSYRHTVWFQGGVVRGKGEK